MKMRTNIEGWGDAEIITGRKSVQMGEYHEYFKIFFKEEADSETKVLLVPVNSIARAMLCDKYIEAPLFTGGVR